MLKTWAKVFGYVFILIGILGFIPGVTTSDGLLFGIFQVDAVHNIIHLVSGAFALYAGMAADSKSSKLYFQIFGIIYAIIAILGFVYGSDPLLGFIAHNTADTWLHVVIAVVALYLGFAVNE